MFVLAVNVYVFKRSSLSCVLSGVAMPQKDPCQKQACAIQHCLQGKNYVAIKNSSSFILFFPPLCHIFCLANCPLPAANKYVESMCEDVIRDMRRCCEIHAAKSICCSGFKDPKSKEDQVTHSTQWNALDRSFLRKFVPVFLITYLSVVCVTVCITTL